MIRRHTFHALTLGAAALAGALALAGCGSKSSGVSGPGSGTATLNGFITLAGTSGTPVAGAVVKTTNGDSTVTDAGGQFSLRLPAGQDVRVDVTKSNYTLNQLHVSLSANESRSVSVGLLAAGATAPMPVSGGGAITDPSSKAKITFPPNFVTGSGNVSVTITGLDPTTDQITALPGGLTAIDGTGATKFLKPVSFAEYTVRDAAGNVLPFNPAAGGGANIELPIPESLRGQPGYQNGDPIECYVYDPADGKWKTPVPGVIGPSSVDGQPAIKATIFHLSWYGGAPATSDVACIQGTVRDSLERPLAGVSVEAFQGGRGTTDANGHYQIEAAAHSTVRVVTSRLVGGVFQTASDTVQTLGASDACITSNLELRTRRPSYSVTAQMGDADEGGDPVSTVFVQLRLGDEVTGIAVSGANVQVGTGGTWHTIPQISPGTGYYVSAGDFTLTPGALYTLRVDYGNDGTFDATGQVHMASVVDVTTPAAASVVPRTFTAAWTDPGAGVSGYAPVYFGINSHVDGVGDLTPHTMFLTTSTSRVLGSGVADPLTGQPNPQLTAGAYELLLSCSSGPYGASSGTPGVPSGPNVSGNGTVGYFYSQSITPEILYSSNGAAGRPASAAVASRTGVRGRESARERAVRLDRALPTRLSHVRVLELLEQYRAKHRAAGGAARTVRASR